MMQQDSDSLLSFIVGLFIGLVVAFCVGSYARDTAITKTQIFACGTCQEKGKMCGEFVCTKDGWK